MAANPRLIDISGQQFDRWTVLQKAGNDSRGGAIWLCRCACGTERGVLGADLRQGKSRSCGCEGSRATVGARSKTHGATRTRLYTTWKNMKKRCADLADPRYGGKGISVWQEWHDFAAFRDWALANGYADDLTIERKDSDGDYHPGNCEWADAKTQARNRSIVLRAPDGRAWAEIAEEHGIPATVMQNRIHSGGWPPEVAATWPVGKRRATRPRTEAGKFAAHEPTWRR